MAALYGQGVALADVRSISEADSRARGRWWFWQTPGPSSTRYGVYAPGFAQLPKTCSAAIPGGCAHSCWVSAAIFDSGLVEALARSGLIHLLAISGLHVGLLLALARGLLCLTGASPGTRRVAEIALLILLVELVAARPPVLRAATMGLIHVGSASLGRRSPLLGSLAVAVLLLTLPDPYVVRDLGFQLSLAAVTGILLIVPRLMATLGPTTPRWLALPAALAVTTLAAQLSVAPLLAATSHRISVAALVLNLAAVPTMTVAMSTCVAAVLFHGMGLSSLAGAFATATTTLFELLATLAGTAESWSWSSVPIERVTAPVVGLYYVGLLASLLDVRGSGFRCRGSIAAKPTRG